ncbi:cupin domain-containing protein [Desulfoprunum benzoelyticum]|uniref:Quercetin dioxygenase-like cupin family protein n=1 Tax=Desulfoprunum benzoelyticum TaxID=1506996 RepID=A0A840USQ0_9BACT|nr:cupin domain-containing protein [Desulfoprunum benzoelyticum]MBB5349237.1 quercetin dioxygenase-like cupin family protein [Desulfoprunum benzoelyticum]MBM9530832.1 cupin domain-containing protein [Desulfoprunum benzoelyticum]
MAFWDLNTLPLEEFRPGIVSKAEFGNDLIMVCMKIAADMEDAGHVHPFDQCGVVLDGKIEMFVGNDRRLLTARQSYFIPAGQRHGWKTFEEAVTLLDVAVKQPPQ